MSNGDAGGGGNQESGHDNKNLIVNYLPQALTDIEFRNMFSTVGAIKKCRIMRNMQTNYSYGYGFVEYCNPDDADRAIEQLDRLEVQNKRIKVSYARPPGQDIKDTNLYIQNLPRNIDESYLDRIFSPHGRIVQRHLLLDKYTQLPRGVGFVRFSLRAEAQAAIAALNGTVPEGGSQALSVKVAQDFTKNKMQENSNGNFAPNMPGGGGRGQFGRGGPRGAGRGFRGGGRGMGRGGAPAIPPFDPMGARPGRGGALAVTYDPSQSAAGYGAAAGYGNFNNPAAAAGGGGDYTDTYGDYSGGYGDYGTADTVEYAHGYGDFTAAAYQAPYQSVGQPAVVPDAAGWTAGRGQQPLRRGGRGMNKTNNRFNPMGAGF